jgi:hypothetical protein
MKTISCDVILSNDDKHATTGYGYLSQNHTPLGVKQLIMRHLLHRLEPTNNSTTLPNEDDIEIAKVIQKQTIIGWENFIRGRLSLE